jgi:hypothetical protein
MEATYPHPPALMGFYSWEHFPQTLWQRGTLPLHSPGVGVTWNIAKLRREYLVVNR